MNSMGELKQEIRLMNLGDQQPRAERLIEVAYLLGQRDGLKEAKAIAISQSAMSWQEATS